MTAYLDEAQLELTPTDSLRELGYEYLHRAHFAPAPSALRSIHRLTNSNRIVATSWWQE